MNPAPVDSGHKLSNSARKTFHIKKAIRDLVLSDKQQTVSKFDNLPVEIIERILMKLDLGDLASVAGVNAYLRAIANGIFIRLNPDKKLALKIDANRNRENELTRAIDAIRILHRFGPFITKLNIEMINDFNSNQNGLMRAISYFCADYLRQLKIDYIPENYQFNTKFMKMECLTISMYRQTERRLDDLNEWFPNLKRFKLGNDKIFVYKKKYGGWLGRVERQR